VSEPWFDERELERWTPRLPADEQAELDLAIDRFRRLLADPATPTLRIELADGSAYGPEEIAVIAAESAELLVGSVRAESIDAVDLGNLISAATNLQVIAVTLVETLAAAGTGREDEAMGLAAALSRILQQAFGALDRSVVRTPAGTFRLRWSDADRALVRRLAAQLDASLDGDDESLVRLFPPAYGTDETRSREYAALAREELIESRRAALATVEAAVERNEVDADELHALMRAVNDLRLVLGTELDVSEDDTRRRAPRGPDAERWRDYERLTHLLSQMVVALG
jgi:hypothetical protein